MIGIYKITNPKGRIYIGQSVNIEKRFGDYRRLKNVNEQPKLYNSFLKHGMEKHNFEIILECSVLELNNKERYFQELYNCLINGLNCNYVKADDRSGLLSEETKQKISLSKKGQGKGIAKSESFKLKVSINNKNRVWKQSSKDKLSKRMIGLNVGELNHFFNKKHSQESLLKISESQKGRVSPMKNKKHSIESKIKMSKTQRNKNNILGSNGNAKIVLDTQNGVYYDCVKELSLHLGVCRISLARKIRGERKNDTNYIYV